MEFYYDGDGLSGFKDGETQYIYRKNAQGDIAEILDTNGAVMVQYTYNAWGKCTVTDSTATGLGERNPFRYRSYYWDGDYYYLKSRYYDPETGRFLSQDDVSYLDPEHVNGLNLFAYCWDNPVMCVDIYGNIAISLTIFGLLCATVALILYVESHFHPIQNTLDWIADLFSNIDWEGVGNATTDMAEAVGQTVSNGILRLFYMGKSKGRGRESDLAKKKDGELDGLIDEAKKKGDVREVLRLIKEQKNRKLRNKRKRRGGPHMRGLWFLLPEVIRRLTSHYETAG